jgi:hypothetical protein
MIIKLGNASDATKSVMPAGAVRDPVPFPPGKAYPVGRLG